MGSIRMGVADISIFERLNVPIERIHLRITVKVTYLTGWARFDLFGSCGRRNWGRRSFGNSGVHFEENAARLLGNPFFENAHVLIQLYRK